MWSGTGTEEVFFRLISTKAPVVTDDAYVVLAGSQLSANQTIGLLLNDETPPATAVNVSSFSSGRIVAAGADGTFNYAPGSFKGIDDVQYGVLLPDGTTTTAHAKVYIVPVNVAHFDDAQSRRADGRGADRGNLPGLLRPRRR